MVACLISLFLFPFFVSLSWFIDAEIYLHVCQGIVKKKKRVNWQNDNSNIFDPIASRQIDGETLETVTDFVFWGSKITVDGYCSHEMKRHSLGEKL